MQVRRVFVLLLAALWPGPVRAAEYALDCRFRRSEDLIGWTIFDSLKPKVEPDQGQDGTLLLDGRVVPGGSSYFMVSDPLPLKSRHHYRLD